jgi:hypothetical protein
MVSCALGPFFMFCAPGLIFSGTKGVASRFHVLRSQNHFRRYLGRRVPFSFFALPNSFLTIPRLSGPVFIFCAPELIFDGFGGVESSFHVLSSRNHFRRNRGRWVPFSCFTLPNSFSPVPRAPVPVLMFCALVLILIGTEGLESRIHVFRSRNHFRRYRGRQVPYSCFALLDSFSAVPRSSGPVFMFGAPGLVLDGSEGVGSSFNVSRSRTYFQRYRGRQVPFSYFALSD